MDPTIRLRIATRIHFALLRHYGEDVGVSTLLKGEAEAREALWVCQASGHKELVSLAKQFETATRQETRAVRLRQQEARIEASTVALLRVSESASAADTPSRFLRAWYTSAHVE